MTMIDKGQVAQAGMAQAIAALRLETRTKMRASKTNWLAHANKVWKLGARTRVDALARLEKLYEETYGRKYGS